MKLTNKEKLSRLLSIKSSITAHPDCEEGTEFADMVIQLSAVMNSIRTEMPEKLTAEEGHKYLLVGEFHATRMVSNQPEECSCDGECEYCMSLEYQEALDFEETEEKVPIDWSTMKEIYSRVVQYEKAKQQLRALQIEASELSYDELKSEKGQELVIRIHVLREELFAATN